MEIQQIIAKNIKDAREGKKLTLDAAASLTGVSRSMLAQIEKGDVNPTISVLWKIANGYKVSFTSLVDSGDQAALVLRHEDITPLVESEGKYLNYPMFPFQHSRQFETYMIEIKSQGFLQAQPHMSGTEEYITVFDGQVEICAGEEAFQLKTGDSLRFKADVAHSYKNIGEEDVRLSMLIYYENR